MQRNRQSELTILGILMIAAATVILFSPRSVKAGGTGVQSFTNTPLITQDGKTVRFYDDLIKGKSVVINFIYTQCGDSCPLETAKLAQVQKLLGDRVGKDIFFYSISIDPKRDSP